MEQDPCRVAKNRVFILSDRNRYTEWTESLKMLLDDMQFCEASVQFGHWLGCNNRHLHSA